MVNFYEWNKFNFIFYYFAGKGGFSACDSLKEDPLTFILSNCSFDLCLSGTTNGQTVVCTDDNLGGVFYFGSGANISITSCDFSRNNAGHGGIYIDLFFV
jgi:hypothetical protein